MSPPHAQCPSDSVATGEQKALDSCGLVLSASWLIFRQHLPWTGGSLCPEGKLRFLSAERFDTPSGTEEDASKGYQGTKGLKTIHEGIF